MAICTSCGSYLKFDIASQSLKCISCGQSFDPYEVDKVVEAEKEEYYDANVFTCPQCAGEIVGNEQNLTGKCSFCGSDVVFTSRFEKMRKPKYIIPFQITKEECKKKYLENLENFKFTPEILKDEEFIDGFRGIYVPYWIYKAQQKSEFVMERTRSRSDSSYDYTDYYEVSGNTNAVFGQISHDATTICYDDISEKVEPFMLHDNTQQGKEHLKPFCPSFLSGFYAEPAEVKEETYHEYVEDVARTAVLDKLNTSTTFKKYDTKTFSEKDAKKLFPVDIQGAEMALFPIWFLSYRKNNRVSYAAINGQTGRVMSNIPIDFGKVLKKIGITALGWFLLLSFFTIQPITTTMIAVLMSFVVTLYLNGDMNLAMSSFVKEEDNKSRIKKGGDSAGPFVFFVVMIFLLGIYKIICLLDSEAAEAVTCTTLFLLSAGICIPNFIFAIKVSIKQLKMEKGSYTKVPYQWLSFLAGLVGTVALGCHFVEDAYYYLAAFFVMVIEAVVFAAIIRNYNKIATKPLPQFQLHTGGDDNA